MAFTKRSTIRVTILWLFIVPPGLFYVLRNYPPDQINWGYIAFFMLFGFLTVHFPIVRNGTPVFLVMWVTVPAFLMYGLFVEMIVMQFSILANLLAKPSKMPLLYRFCLNSLMFFFLSIIAAVTFNFVGGEIGSIQFWPVIFASFCYQIVHSIVYHTILKAYSKYKNLESSFFSKDILIDYALIFAILPLSLTIYFLLKLVGFGTFFLLGIPFFFITAITYLYNSSERINRNLQQAGEIGHGLSNLMTEKDVIDQFVIEMSDMFQTDYIYLFDHKEGWLELIRSFERGRFVDIDFSNLAAGQGIAGAVLERNEPVIYKKREEWVTISKDYSPDEMQSILCVPVSRNQKIEAVVFLASRKKSSFEDYQLKILDLLCSYFTVNVEKARYMEAAVMNSERCALTNLYNYRYLEDRLIYENDRLRNNLISDLSVVMLDIDHFKKVNDTYGHQSGNDILYLLGRKLESLLPPGGTIARYGGEEFVFLLPGKSKTDAVKFAENLRTEIEGYDFTIIPDLGEDKYPLVIHITSSIGVSSAPDDTDEAMALLRNADRALYIGAKQAGRNRVAQYVK